MIKSAFILSAFALSVPYKVLACQPMPTSMFFANSIQAILSSPEIWAKFDRFENFTGITKLDHDRFLITTNKCSLEVRLKFERPTHPGPCGGVAKIIASPEENPICKN